MEWIHIPGTEIEISAEPVAHADYEAFARQTGHHLPHHPGSSGSPATGVSAHDAEDYAAWLSEKGPWRYRLPTLDEMCWLARYEAGQNDWLGWPESGPDDLPLDRDCLEEWLAGSPIRRGHNGNPLHPITHPQWLTADSGRVPYAEITDAPHWFVTFRLVRQPKSHQ